MIDTQSPGLTSAEVAERVARGQVNRAPRSQWREYAEIVRHNVFTLFNALVVPAAIALFVLDEYRGAIAVSGFAVINSVLGLAQEIRAKRHLDKLAILVETRARVLRDGEERTIPAGDVVLGEHILLTTGEPVVADGPVIEASFLEVDEALLTGESDPVPRRPGDPLLSGSYCVAGSGRYRAERVGGASFAQHTSIEARAYTYSASPIQEAINLLIRILTTTAVVLCILYVGLYVVREFPTTDLVQMVAATITAMVPQGLVLMATLAFTLGAVRMTARGAVVQRLNAVESMAAVNMLCMDKTGTLTTNQLRVAEVRPVAADVPEKDIQRKLQLFASASVDRQNKSIQALRAYLGETAVELLDQLPFKSQNRYSAVRVRCEQGERVLVLGACEALRHHVKEGECDHWEGCWREMLPTGQRLLLFAEAGQLAPFDGSLDGFTLRPLALVALSDELRPSAGRVLEELAGQGIGFKILSGDNPETVRATVRHLDLYLAHEPVVSGDQLAADADRAALIRSHSVFGRVAPQQKVEIVSTLKEQGYYVAMIGDGVNDVLPIKRAHLGIAMGEGSAASKTVSGLVLENNNFELLPETLEEGRTIIRNLRRCGKLFLVKNMYTLLLIVFALGVFRLEFPYLPQQVTLLNLLTIGIPAFAIALSRERSTAATRPGFLREVGWFAIRTGLIIGIAGLIMMVIAHRLHDDRMTRTLLLSTLTLLGVTTLLRALTDGESQPLRGDSNFRWLAVGALPVYGIAMYVPPAADFFQLVPLGLAQWGLVLAVAGPAYGLCLLSDRLRV
jgi:cation-transporting ATPase E